MRAGEYDPRSPGSGAAPAAGIQLTVGHGLAYQVCWLGAIVFGFFTILFAVFMEQPPPPATPYFRWIIAASFGVPAGLCAYGIAYLRPNRIFQVDDVGVRLLRGDTRRPLQDLPWGQITTVMYGRKVIPTGPYSATEGQVLYLRTRRPWRRISLDDVAFGISDMELEPITQEVIRIARAWSITVRPAQRQRPAPPRPGPRRR